MGTADVKAPRFCDAPGAVADDAEEAVAGRCMVGFALVGHITPAEVLGRWAGCGAGCAGVNVAPATPLCGIVLAPFILVYIGVAGSDTGVETRMFGAGSSIRASGQVGCVVPSRTRSRLSLIHI